MNKYVRISASRRYSGIAKYHLTKADGKFTVSWRARIEWPRRADGSKPPATDVWAPTESEAERKRAARRAEMETQGHGRARVDKVKAIEAAGRTFCQHLESDYFPLLLAESENRTKGRSRAYVRGRIGRFRNYFIGASICPEIKVLPIRTLPIRRVEPKHLEAYFKALVVGKVSNGNKVAIKNDWMDLLRRVRDTLPQAPNNYWAFLRDGGLRITVVEPPAKELWNATDVLRALVDPAVPPVYRAAAALLFDALRRPSELWALDWPDVDFGRSIVTFNKAQRLSPHGGNEIGILKEGNKSRKLSSGLTPVGCEE